MQTAPPRTRRSSHPGPLDVTLHLIIARHHDGAYAAERDVAALDFESTVADIMAGQIEEVERVIALNPAEAWAREVTEDIAIEIARRIGRQNGSRPIQPGLRDFIEQHAGLEFARGLALTEPAFSAA